MNRAIAIIKTTPFDRLFHGEESAHQRGAIKAFCDSRERAVTRTFDLPLEEDKGFIELLNIVAIAQACHAVIVVQNPRRISEIYADREIFFNYCSNLGVEVWSAEDEVELALDESDPMRQLIRDTLRRNRRWQIAKLKQQMREGKRRAQMRGEHCYGPHPYCNPIVIERIGQLTKEGWTVRKIAKQLFNERLKPPRGGTFWSPSTIHKIRKTLKQRQ